MVMIGITLAAVTTATVAYFTDTLSINNNTFATGTVDLDDTWTSGLPFNFSNLTPGNESISEVLGVGYGGSIPADLYFGAKAQSGDNLKDILEYYIEEVDSSGTHISNVTGWNGVVNAFAGWTKIAENLNSSDWKYYKIHLRVLSTTDNNYQGKSATNIIFIHAVQHGQSAPTTAPWEYTPTP